ncbi:5-hydroxytryptamine receptor 3A-like [Cheilinus undulatus]|uniref:5-hydroxytryptamine receptor 3A-like n=1 Tax=Cheilinus undulatus TaxID=241271 RepID=UPI001BD50BCC|nr:5-hydroxytryptamine receptor 3A-like [Cheilinus undulatus]
MVLLSRVECAQWYNQDIKQAKNSSDHSAVVAIESQNDVSSECSNVDIIRHLNMTDKVKYFMTRPAKNYINPTNVTLDVHLYAILDLLWDNPFISWRTEDFCDNPFVYFPSELLWKPDITIEEMTEKDKASQTPFLALRHDGTVFLRNGMVLVSTCRMQFYRFPFDIQRCSLTFKSITMLAEDLKLSASEENLNSDSDEDVQSEWILMNITVRSEEVEKYGINSSVVVYTITMRRRSVLYAFNFLLPILFFLGLDLASFLILDSGGEKLSFKVTVLLAVTVMQLILNEILPSSSDRIPLIVVYCTGIFGLMMMSLVETIVVMYLMQKDSVQQVREEEKDQDLDVDGRAKPGKVHSCFKGMTKSVQCPCFLDVSPAETPPALLPLGSSSQLTQESHDLQQVSEELKEVMKMMTLILNNRKKEEKPGYWTRKRTTSAQSWKNLE